MEISKDGSKVRYYAYSKWDAIDPKTGLIALDEGLYFHFKEKDSGVEVSIRTKRWWGVQVLYRNTFDGVEVTGSEDLLQLSCRLFEYFRGGLSHTRYKAEKVRKSKKQAKFMGSYEDRDVRKVDSV